LVLISQNAELDGDARILQVPPDHTAPCCRSTGTDLIDQNICRLDERAQPVRHC
jgi:hypothetical protein